MHVVVVVQCEQTTVPRLLRLSYCQQLAILLSHQQIRPRELQNGFEDLMFLIVAKKDLVFSK